MALTRKQRRTALVGGGLLLLGAAMALILTAMSGSIVFFFSPSDVAARGVAEGQRIRVGGLVEVGSVTREGTSVHFRITDGVETVTVAFTGQLPDLFREGQGVVVQGVFAGGHVFAADEVLAKHDETYMPPEVADALKRSGHWREGQTMQ